MRRVWLLLCTAPLCACSVHRAELHATELAQLTHKVSLQANEIQQKQTQLVRARQVLVNQVNRNAGTMEQDIAAQVQQWRLSGHPELVQVFQDLHDGAQADLQRAQSRVQQAAEQAQFLAGLRSQARFEIGKLDETAKALAQIGEPGSLRDHLKFFAGFLQDARTALNQLQAQSQAATTALMTATPGMSSPSPPPPQAPAATQPIVE